MASSLFLLDSKGKILIFRDYRGDVPLDAIENFIQIYFEKEQDASLTPILEYEGSHFLYIKHQNIFLVATCSRNANAMLIFTFLHKLIKVLTEYFKNLEEESIRDNFVLIFELFDEVMDYGLPQTTESQVLKTFITQQSSKLEVAPRPPMAVTNAVSWRIEGIKHRKNEVFLDVVESVNVVVSAAGRVVRHDITGAIKMRVFLSGMPELRLGLNDKFNFQQPDQASGEGSSRATFEDVRMHQCVRLNRFDTDRVISFIPPDGAFDLLSYRLNIDAKPVIWIETNIERHAHSRISMHIKLTPTFKRRLTASNVVVSIPVPPDADSPRFKLSMGAVRYAPELSCVEWTIKQLPGGKEAFLRTELSLPSISGEEAAGRPPITVKFELLHHTVSGLQVRYLKVIEKSGYEALPWVRYITQNGGL